MSNVLPLYQQIVDHLLERIETNVLRPGDRIPTEQEITEAFGVSRITAVRAVKELETRGLVTRTKGRGSFVTSKSAWHNNGPGPPRPLVVSLVLPFQELLAIGVLVGVERLIHADGYHTSFRNSAGDVSRERQILMKDSEDGVAGMIVYPCSSVENAGAFSSLLVRRFPVVVIDRRLRGIETPFVAVDNTRGTYEATRHLVELGHRDIAFVAEAAVSIESEAERFHGYCRALMEARIPVQDDLVIDRFGEHLVHRGGNPPEQFAVAPSATTERIMDTLFDLATPPTAIVSINDAAAAQFVKCALQRGIRVPQDLSVVGFDNLPFSAHIEVPLTTVEQPFREIGERAAAILLSRIANPSAPYQSELLEPRLIVRDSTAPPRRAGS